MPETDFRQSAGYINFLKKNGWIIKEYGINNCEQYAFIWKIPHTFFSVIRLHRFNQPELLEKVEKLIEKYRAVSIRVEPKIFDCDKSEITPLLKKFGYSQSNWSHNPTKTIKIPLHNYEKGLKTKTKYNIRLSKKRGVSVYSLDGIQLLANKTLLQNIYTVLSDNDKRISLPVYPKNWFTDLLKSFGKDSLIAVGMIDKEIAGFVFFIINNDTVYYTLNGSTEKGRKNFAPSLIINEAVKLAKLKKINFLDFDGVYDERLHGSTYSWKGFTKFKESFGGQPVYYLPAYEKKLPYNYNFWIKIIKKTYVPRYLPSIYPEPLNF